MNNLKYPSVSEIEKAFISADAEFDKADGTKLAEYEQMFVIKNSRLNGHLETRRTAVASWDWDIIPFEAKDAELALQAKRRLRRVINKVIPGRVNAPLFGYYAIDIEFELAEGQTERVPKIVRIYKPGEILVANSEMIKIKEGDKIITKSRQSLSNAGEAINPIFTLIDVDGKDYRGGALLSTAISEILRIDMLAEWANWAKKQKGMIQGVSMGADETELDAAEEGMRNLLKNNYILTSDLIDMKFHQIANSSAGGSFKDINQELNNAISIAILGQANTSELPSGGGSRAALEVQRLVSADIMFSDAIATHELINDQLLPIDFYFNKQSSQPPYEFKINFAEQTDYEGNARVIADALAAGIQLKKSEVYERLGYSVPQEGDELIAGIGA